LNLRSLHRGYLNGVLNGSIIAGREVENTQEARVAIELAGYTSIINTLRMPVRQGFGFAIEPLGLPQTIDGETAIAVLFHVSEEDLSAVRKAVTSIQPCSDARSRNVGQHEAPDA
jgi:hypothetical protein